MLYSFSNFAISAQHDTVMFSPAEDLPFTSLRLCTEAGTHFFMVGTPEDPEFYEVAPILAGLLSAADTFDSPLPAALPSPAAFIAFTPVEQLILVSAGLGVDMHTLAAQAGSSTALQVLMDKAKSLNLIIAKATNVTPLLMDLRASRVATAMAAKRNQDHETRIADIVEAPTVSVQESPFMQIIPGGAAMLERLERMHPSHRAQAERTKWPFKDMQPGDVVRIPALLAKRAQTAVHVYAARVGKRFTSSSERGTGVLTIVRLSDKAGRGL
jgi:hypothetical protein